MITGKECEEFLEQRALLDQARERGKRRGREIAAEAEQAVLSALCAQRAMGVVYGLAYRQAVQEGFDSALGIRTQCPWCERDLT